MKNGLIPVTAISTIIDINTCIDIVAKITTAYVEPA